VIHRRIPASTSGDFRRYINFLKLKSGCDRAFQLFCAGRQDEL
jgi:hypothetical protein